MSPHSPSWKRREALIVDLSSGVIGGGFLESRINYVSVGGEGGRGGGEGGEGERGCFSNQNSILPLPTIFPFPEGRGLPIRVGNP